MLSKKEKDMFIERPEDTYFSFRAVKTIRLRISFFFFFSFENSE